MKQNLIKIALFLGYALFAGWSAFFTASSFVHKWFSSQLFWLVYIIAFIFAMLAGYFLTLMIREIKNSVNPSKAKFFGAIILFLLFWGVSFATNVHYFIVTQHGYDNLSRQVSDCKHYLEFANSQSENMAKKKREDVHAQVYKHLDRFQNSLESSRIGFDGLGDECISELKAIASYLNSDTASLHERNHNYVIWDEAHHGGFRKNQGYNDYGKIREVFSNIVNEAVKRKFDTINSYYESVYPQQSKDAFEKVTEIETTKLPKLKDSGSFDDIYGCYRNEVMPLLGQMPQEYQKQINNNTTIYPSERMFDFWTVWKDKFNGRIPDYISFGGAIPMALLFDISGFILLALI